MSARPFLLGLPCIILLAATSCTTTDDPHKGGLIGYMATGEEGYQRRIDNRQSELSDVQTKTREEKNQTYGLKDSRESLSARLQKQREAMQAMDDEIARLRAECEKLSQLPEDKEIERLRILDELAVVQNHSRELSGDSSMLIQEKEATLRKLQDEVALLLERYSLLTTL